MLQTGTCKEGLSGASNKGRSPGGSRPAPAGHQKPMRLSARPHYTIPQQTSGARPRAHHGAPRLRTVPTSKSMPPLAGGYGDLYKGLMRRFVKRPPRLPIIFSALRQSSLLRDVVYRRSLPDPCERRSPRGVSPLRADWNRAPQHCRRSLRHYARSHPPFRIWRDGI
jgi:hypothetical protein